MCVRSQPACRSSLNGLFEVPHDYPPQWVLMLTLYLDESHNPESDLWIVAGYLGKRKHWKKYLKLWPLELGDRDHLHLTEMRLNSPKAERRHGDMLKRLAVVPEKCGLKAFVGSICVRDVAHLTAGNILEAIMQGYVFAILALMDELVTHLPKGERVQVVFEEQVAYAAQRARAMELWKDRHRYPSGKSVLASWTSIEKGTLTEASDYLCYALSQRSINPESQKARLTAPILKQQRHSYHISKEKAESWIHDAAIARGRPPLPLTPELKRKFRLGSL